MESFIQNISQIQILMYHLSYSSSKLNLIILIKQIKEERIRSCYFKPVHHLICVNIIGFAITVLLSWLIINLI